MKILLVAADTEPWRAHSEALRKEGFQIDTCDDDRQAVALAATAHYDLILLDGKTRDLDGAELAGHVRALLRRATTPRLQVGALELDRNQARALLDGRELALTHREFKILLYLAHRAELLVSRDELALQVPSTRPGSTSNRVEVSISRLRAKLGEHAWMLETVRGGGYRLRMNRRG
jgi:DNA-binding response OmpR family regulator